jgi:hypothetical protein
MTYTITSFNRPLPGFVAGRGDCEKGHTLKCVYIPHICYNMRSQGEV